MEKRNRQREAGGEQAAEAIGHTLPRCSREAHAAQADGLRPIGGGSLRMTMVIRRACITHSPGGKISHHSTRPVVRVKRSAGSGTLLAS
jgi:hypothetical protein